MNGRPEEHALILARHWREARGGRFPARWDGRRFDGLAKLVVSVQQRALERRLAFVQWASAEWMRPVREAA